MTGRKWPGVVWGRNGRENVRVGGMAGRMSGWGEWSGECARGGGMTGRKWSGVVWGRNGRGNVLGGNDR